MEGWDQKGQTENNVCSLGSSFKICLYQAWSFWNSWLHKVYYYYYYYFAKFLIGKSCTFPVSWLYFCKTVNLYHYISNKVEQQAYIFSFQSNWWTQAPISCVWDRGGWGGFFGKTKSNSGLCPTDPVCVLHWILWERLHWSYVWNPQVVFLSIIASHLVTHITTLLESDGRWTVGSTQGKYRWIEMSPKRQVVKDRPQKGTKHHFPWIPNPWEIPKRQLEKLQVSLVQPECPKDVHKMYRVNYAFSESNYFDANLHDL